MQGTESRTAAIRRANLRRYDLTPEQYDLMLAEQQGKCAICEEFPKKKRLFVDHDHRTETKRGLICHNCNAALGHVRDSVGILSAMISYLHTHQASSIGAD